MDFRQTGFIVEHQTAIYLGAIVNADGNLFSYACLIVQSIYMEFIKKHGLGLHGGMNVCEYVNHKLFLNNIFYSILLDVSRFFCCYLLGICLF